MVVTDSVEAGLLEADRQAATAGEQVDAPQGLVGLDETKDGNINLEQKGRRKAVPGIC